MPNANKRLKLCQESVCLKKYNHQPQLASAFILTKSQKELCILHHAAFESYLQQLFPYYFNSLHSNWSGCVWTSVCFGKFGPPSPWDTRAIASVWSHANVWQARPLIGGFISVILFHPHPCLSPHADIPHLQHVHREWRWAGLSGRGNSTALLEVQFPACHPTIWVTAQLTDTKTLKEAITSSGGMSFLKENDPCFHLSPLSLHGWLLFLIMS